VQKAWIGRVRPIHWPPDLTPYDFQLRQYVNDQVYQLPMPQSLRERISEATATADESQLRGTWEEFEYRVDVCRVTNGARVEQL
jgi:hypothetical protein